MRGVMDEFVLMDTGGGADLEEDRTAVVSVVNLRAGSESAYRHIKSYSK